MSWSTWCILVIVGFVLIFVSASALAFTKIISTNCLVLTIAGAFVVGAIITCPLIPWPWVKD